MERRNSTRGGPNAIETWGPVAMLKSGMPPRSDGDGDGGRGTTTGATSVLVRVSDAEAICESGGREVAFASQYET
jgi:hypothetical protein